MPCNILGVIEGKFENYLWKYLEVLLAEFYFFQSQVAKQVISHVYNYVNNGNFSRDIASQCKDLFFIFLQVFLHSVPLAAVLSVFLFENFFGNLSNSSQNYSTVPFKKSFGITINHVVIFAYFHTHTLPLVVFCTYNNFKW